MNRVISTNQSKIPCETYNVILSRDSFTIAAAGNVYVYILVYALAILSA
jgi:hypothetical protein